MAIRPLRLLGDALTLAFVSRRWRMPIWIALGVFVGMGLAVARISRATSYLSDDPETCVNCHVMYPQYTSWQHGSHRNVATCNDCHVPHDNFVHHYSFKARDGLRHSTIYTMRTEPQVIRLSAGAVPVIENNCRRCHQDQVSQVHIARPGEGSGEFLCWDCHRETPHGRGRNLAAAPVVLRPQLPAIGFNDPGVTIGGRAPRPTQGGQP